MKFNGKVISGANVEYVVIPRPGVDIVFKCTAIMDMKPFYDMCPQPKPPSVRIPGGAIQHNVKDAGYLAQVKEYGDLRYLFTILWSLKDSPGLEFDKVVYDRPETWKFFETELKEAGFNYQEIQRVIIGCMTANSLTEEKLTEARERFLASLVDTQDPLSSQSMAVVPPNTQSGVPASASV